VGINNGKSGKTEFRAGYLQPILSAYLQANRRRDDLKDVQARLLLARCCVQLGDADRAVSALSSCPVVASPKSTEEAMLYRDIQGMIQELKR
jgi:thioredoxin-like negative regulator of GroEL